jgi:hypothetical protein
MIIVKKLLLVLSLIFFVGCATILDGTKQVVSINSNVQGANVYIDGIQVGQTPFTTQIKKKKGTQVRVDKKGHTSKTMSMTTSLPTVFWGNIIFGGFTGSTTDFVSGAAYEYSPNNYFFHLDSTKEVSDEEAKTSEVEKNTTKFILVNHQNLVKEIAKGDGEYLASLLELLNSEMKPNELALKLKTVNYEKLTSVQMAKMISEL